jgi:AcrR family transcriptional regulator
LNTKPEQSKKDTLLDVACQLFLERGYDDVSMQQIAESSGMTKAAPYYHFKNKDDLFIHVYVREMSRIHERVREHLEQSGPFRDRIEQALVALVNESKSDVARLFSEFERFMTLTSERDLVGNVADKIDAMKVLLPYFVEAHRAGELSRFAPDQCCYLFLLMVMGHFQWMSVPKFNPAYARSSEAMAHELAELFFHGVA